MYLYLSTFMKLFFKKTLGDSEKDCKNFGSESELELNGNHFSYKWNESELVPNIDQRIGTDRGPKNLEWLTVRPL